MKATSDMNRHESYLNEVVRLCDLGFIDVGLACPYLGANEFYAEEVVDAFQQLSDSLRAEAFPFFDERFYASQLGTPLSPDDNPLGHFLKVGINSRVSPHPLIRPTFMLQARPDLFGNTLDLHQFITAITSDWCDPSPFLWLTWYRAKVGLDANNVALLHYLRHGGAQNFPPNPYFQPEAYASAEPEAPRNGVALVLHFLSQGDCALRPVGNRFDPIWYLSQHPEAKTETIGPLWYFLSVGRHLGHAPMEASQAWAGTRKLSRDTNDSSVPEVQSVIQERYDRFVGALADARLARLTSFREEPIAPVKIIDHAKILGELFFLEEADPEVDVLIPCYNEFEFTVECLVALRRAQGQRRLRIFIIDDASPDRRLELFNRIPGLVVIRHTENLNFLRSCNRAFAATSAPFLLLLNNDTQVMDCAIDKLVDAVESHSDIGAAAPMFLYPNGRLQEAGCTLRHDGDSTMIGVGEDPAQLCYSYRRDIQYGSGAALLIRREALAGQLFDDRFAPLYCEDADLCLRLRDTGWRIIYEPEAQIVHHLSASTGRSRRRRVQGIRVNQQKLLEKWASRLGKENRARVLAFYLPQFHPIERNNLWWGKGFTEWTNVTRALPSFEGHYQPHLPADLGYYDLRRVETLGEQQALARRYGIEGFAVYYYNFGAARILEQPMETLLRHPEIDFRFALCWANENWTRHWDGGQRSMLLEQLYDDDTLDSVSADMVRFSADPRAIRVDNKPLVMIYRPLLIPDVVAVTDRLRRRFAAAGYDGVHLVYVESMEAIGKHVRPADLGFDACVEFPPQGMGEPLTRPVSVSKAGWEGRLYDYAGTARNAVLRPTTNYPRYPAVMPSWDNTARQPLKGTTMVGAEPELFQAYIEQKLNEMLNFHVGEHRFLFVNAWNEWAEGAHLEPDRGYGHRWLMALKCALLAKGVVS